MDSHSIQWKWEGWEIDSIASFGIIAFFFVLLPFHGQTHNTLS